MDHCAARQILRISCSSAAEFADAFTEAGNHCFVLERELPFRAHLFRLGNDEHVLLLVLHHIAGDGWSLGNLSRDVALAYSDRVQGKSPQWAPLSMRYGDYALSQIAALGHETDTAKGTMEKIAETYLQSLRRWPGIRTRIWRTFADSLEPAVQLAATALTSTAMLLERRSRSSEIAAAADWRIGT